MSKKSGITYFCVVCQEKHPVEDIGVDIWGILGEEISRKIRNWLVENPGDDENAAFWDMVKRCWNVVDDETEVDVRVSGDVAKGYRNAFALTAAQAERILLNRRKVGNVLSGIYRITYREMLRLIPKCNAEVFEDHDGKHRRRAGHLTKEAFHEIVEKLPVDDKPGGVDSPVINQLLNVYLADTGAVEHITDENNNPFIRDEEGKKSRKGYLRICAHCGAKLSRATGMAPETVVAMTGSARAGKTSCVIAMIASLLANNSKLYELVEFKDDPTWNPIQDDIDAYRRCHIVQKTNDKGDFTKCISLLLKGKGVDFRRVLTLIDMPGEFWMTEVGVSEEFFKQYSRVFTNLDAIWLLISKATITLARRAQKGTVDEDTAKKLETDTAETVAIIKETRADTLGENLSGLKRTLEAENRVMPPVLVIVTKPDYLIDEEVCNADNVNYSLYPNQAGLLGEENRPALAAEIDRCGREDMNMILANYGMSDYGFEASGLNDYSLRALNFAYYSRMVRSFIQDKYPEFVEKIEAGCRNPDGTSCVSYITMSPYGRPAYKAKGENKKQDEVQEVDVKGPVEPEDVFALVDMAIAAEVSKVMGEQFAEHEEASEIDPNARPHPYHEQYPLLWTMAITNGLSVEQSVKYLRATLKTKLFGEYENDGYGEVRRYFDHRYWRKAMSNCPSAEKKGRLKAAKNDKAEREVLALESTIAHNLMMGENEPSNEVVMTRRKS